MADYTLTPTTLAPIPGVHDGTGTQQQRIWVIDPATVAGSGPLGFVAADCKATTLLFQIADDVVPNWFGVAVPGGIADYANPIVFFHPTPAQAGYVDADYRTKSGKWPELFYYMDRLGYQLDCARKDRVIVMPFLTEAATTTGILPASWQSILTQILSATRAAMGADDGSALAIESVAVASFSAGILYSDSFRTRAVGLAPLLREVWDLDGSFSSYHALSAKLRSTATLQVTQYDQATSGSAFHVPQPRWSAYVQPPTTGDEVHGLVCSFLFTHACWQSPIGARGTNDVA